MLRRCAAIACDRIDQRPVEAEQIDILARLRLIEDLVSGEHCLRHGRFRMGWESIAAGLNGKIIGLPARTRQRKVPPLLRIVHKPLPPSRSRADSATSAEPA